MITRSKSCLNQSNNNIKSNKQLNASKSISNKAIDSKNDITNTEARINSAATTGLSRDIKKAIYKLIQQKDKKLYKFIEEVIDNKIEKLSNKIDKIEIDNNKQINEINHKYDQMYYNEKQFQLNVINKLNNKCTDKLSDITNALDINTNSYEISSPTKSRFSNIGESTNKQTMDLLENRINNLENKVNKPIVNSPNKYKQNDLTRLTNLEQSIADIQLELLKYNQIIDKTRKENNFKSIDNNINTSNYITINEFHKLKKKLKEFTKSSILIYKSLNSGMNDIQNTNLHLYQWGEDVYKAIGELSDGVGMKYNPCPNVPLININSNLMKKNEIDSDIDSLMF